MLVDHGGGHTTGRWRGGGPVVVFVDGAAADRLAGLGARG
jgi:hypothetical protein